MRGDNKNSRTCHHVLVDVISEGPHASMHRGQCLMAKLKRNPESRAIATSHKMSTKMSFIMTEVFSRDSCNKVYKRSVGFRGPARSRIGICTQTIFKCHNPIQEGQFKTYSKEVNRTEVQVNFTKNPGTGPT